MCKRFFTFFSIFFPCSILFSQQVHRTYYIHKTNEQIVVDGLLNEAVWSSCDSATNFWQVSPVDTSLAQSRTEVFVTYNSQYFFVAAICYDDIEGDYVIQSLKRDFSYPVSDAFVVQFDPFNDRTNGFSFGVNPMGVQREGLIANGGYFGVSTDWDNLWYSEVKRYKDRWVVEIAIPFRSIRFKEGIKEWGINFTRNNLKRFENSAWNPVPRNFNVAALSYCGVLIWDESPRRNGISSAIIPYITGGATRDYANRIPLSHVFGAGVDAKLAVSSSLNLDITVNPDYSQVEVDRQVINLSRFNVFFPERRNFFIENSDLFSQPGFRQIRPFFSRNIGLISTNKGLQSIPILGGLRLSGRIDENWRIGLMTMQTARSQQFNIDAQNFTIATVQRQIFKTSNIQFFAVNRQDFEGSKISKLVFNRVAGLDYNLQSADNKWYGKAFFHRSFTHQNLNNPYAFATWISYNRPTLTINWNHEYVNRNYDAAVGFVPRINNYDQATARIFKMSYHRFEPSIEYRLFPKSKKILNYVFGFYYDHYLDSTFKTTDQLYDPYFKTVFRNSSALSLSYNYSTTRLIFLTDVTGRGDKLPVATYRYQTYIANYDSDKRRKFYYSIGCRLGTYYTGEKYSLVSEVNFRRQPWGIFNINYSKDYILLPGLSAPRELDLFGARIELSFTRSIFFTTFLQYNTQSQNVNVNSRLQWRFRPMSDFFLVYTDNYDPLLNIKNRAMIAKWVWWIIP